MATKDRSLEFQNASEAEQQYDGWSNDGASISSWGAYNNTTGHHHQHHHHDNDVDDSREDLELMSVVGSEEDGEDDGGGKAAALKHLDDFMSQIGGLQHDFHLLESYVEDVKIKHSLLMIDIRADDKVKKELDNVIDAFQQLAKSTRLHVKMLQNETDEMHQYVKDNGLPDSAVLRIRRTQLMGVHKRLQNVLSLFNEEQVRHRERCQQRIHGYMQLTGQSMDDEAIEEAIENNQINQFASGLLLRDAGEAKRILADVEARAADIRELERSIRELHSMFLDMALLIEAQGEMVDRIEYNIDQAAVYVESGAAKLREALRYKNRYRRKKVLLACVCAVLIVVLVFLLLSTLCTWVLPCTKWIL